MGADVCDSEQIAAPCHAQSDDSYNTICTSEAVMLETIAVVLIILWLLGLVSSYSLGGLIHVLLVLAIILFLVRIIQGRKI
jgi:hypothetical protein